MKQYITFNAFTDAFSDTYKDNFSYEGKKALFEYLEEYEESAGEEIELDTIALCCEYTEYDSLKELQADYTDIKSMEELEEHTMVIPIEGSEGFIIQQY